MLCMSFHNTFTTKLQNLAHKDIQLMIFSFKILLKLKYILFWQYSQLVIDPLSGDIIPLSMLHGDHLPPGDFVQESFGHFNYILINLYFFLFQGLIPFSLYFSISHFFHSFLSPFLLISLFNLLFLFLSNLSLYRSIYFPNSNSLFLSISMYLSLSLLILLSLYLICLNYTKFKFKWLILTLGRSWLIGKWYVWSDHPYVRGGPSWSF